MPMLHYNIETLGQFLPDASELLVKNWKEIAAYSDIPLKPDFDRYVKLEQEGRLFITTVRDDSKLVGYCIMFKDRHIHYKDMTIATNDVIYLDPEYREGRVGIKLIKLTEDLFKGCIVVWHSKNKHPALGKVLEHFGYIPIETTYMKQIG